MKGSFLTIFIIIFSVTVLEVVVAIVRKHAHAGYFSTYGAVEWGLVAVAWILVAVAWLLGKRNT